MFKYQLRICLTPSKEDPLCHPPSLMPFGGEEIGQRFYLKKLDLETWIMLANYVSGYINTSKPGSLPSQKTLIFDDETIKCCA